MRLSTSCRPSPRYSSKAAAQRSAASEAEPCSSRYGHGHRDGRELEHRRLRVVVEELSASGVSFERYAAQAADENGVHTFGEHRVVWFRDPDGNTLAVDNGGVPSDTP